VAYADATSSSTSMASGLLKRNIRTATGVSAIVVPATRPATDEPVVRRTVWCSSQTAPTPSRAWGTRMLHDDSPKIRTERPMGQSASGVLSTVMLLAASEEPRKNAFHDAEPACAAAE
jgi:hypothetical protein